MIKYRIKKILAISFLCLTLIGPISTSAAIKKGDTLGDLKQQLKTLKKKRDDQKNKQNQTKEEIAANKNNMNKAEYDLEKTRVEITEIEHELERMNEDITKKKKESEEILRLYQVLESENVYMSYVTGASTITESIMRLDAVNQLIEYNEEKLNELELMITSNEKLTKKLDEYKLSLEEKKIKYEASIDVLQEELSELVEGSISIDKEIEALNETIKSYEQLGCKDNQELTTCVDVANNSGWLKPFSRGRVTSLYGYRNKPTASASSFHRGIDIGVAEGTKLYGIAAGTVGAIVRKASCGGNMVYVWAYVNGKPYTYVYMHMLSINVKVGDTVGVNTVIGTVGGGSTSTKRGGYDQCTTGAHLHLGIAKDGFYGTKALPLSKFNSNTFNPPGYPGLYQWFYSR